MTNTYDTSNESLGSTDVKVLYNNASNLDDAVNSDSATWVDRPPFGRMRRTWRGMENAFDQFLAGTAFELPPLNYVDGTTLQVDRATQLIARSGLLYSVKLPSSFPVVLSGTWATDQPLLTVRNDQSLRQELGDTTNAALGAGILGWKSSATGAVGRPLGQKLADAINVKDFGAKGDGVTDDWAAINSAIAYARSFASVSVGPAFMVPPIWFPHGTYAVSKPFLCDEAFKFDGDNARILAKTGYTGISIPLAAGGTETSTQMFIFLKGKKGSQPSATDVVRFGAQLGYGLIVDCQFIAKGPYFERMPYSRVNCQVQMSAGDGITFGNAMWGTSIDDVVIENATVHGIHFLTNSAFNGCSAKNIRIWGEFLTSQSGMTFDLNSECNGLLVSGSFIEKVDFGVIVSGGNGPIAFVGVDFEQCTNRVLLVNGSASPRIGPITLQNCYLHSIGLAKIYTDNGIVNVDGCKLSNVNLTQDFETDLFSRGLINVGPNNIYLNGGTMGIVSGSSVSVQHAETVTRNFWQYLPHKTNSTLPVLNFKNYQYKDAPSLQSSGFIFSSNYAGGPTGQYVSQSDWWISEYQHIAAPGVLTRTVGVRLANLSGQNSFQPMTNNATSCGAAGASWSSGSTQVAFTVVSDERVKTELLDLSDAERRVAVKCKSLIFKFKLKNQVEQKGDNAKWHFGTSAQKVMEAFRGEGLDPSEYDVIEHQRWDAIPDTKGENGEIIPGRAAGDVYAVNYEQLTWFVLSALVN